VILIVSQPEDVHAVHVDGLLRRRGVRPVWFDPSEYPSAAEITLAHDDGGVRMQIERAAGTIDLTAVRAAWFRRPNLPRPSARLKDPLMRRYAELEAQLFLDGMFEAMPCRWLPAPYAGLRRADHKLKQLVLACALGLTTPPTLITNDAGEVFRFYEEHHGRLISKLQSPAAYWLPDKPLTRFTQPVTRGDLGYWPMMRYAPMVYQPRLEKRLELRVTVVGERVFAAEIESQRNARARVDSRIDSMRTPTRPHALPAAVERACRALTHQLGLAYGAIDFIVTPAGEYVFLELTPNGQYLWIEQLTGLPISEAVVDWLLDEKGPDAHPRLV
jgi:hypothetical protein